MLGCRRANNDWRRQFRDLSRQDDPKLGLAVPSPPSAAPSVAAISLRGLLDVVTRDGHCAQSILDPSGLSTSNLEDPDIRIPARVAGEVWARSAAVVGDEHLGLRVGQALKLGSLGLFDYALSRSPTVGEAWRKASEYFRWVADGAVIEIVRDGSFARFEHAGAAPRAISEMIVAGVFCAVGRDTSRVLTPKEVRFRHPAPKDTTRHRRLFGCDVRFGQARDALVVEQEVLEWPLRMADEGLSAVLETYLAQLVVRLPRGGIVLQVQQHVLRGLDAGASSLENVAFKLGMSGRTLQRRLKECGTNHQSIVDAARHDLAKQYLHDAHISAAEVAQMLGFSEASAFQRAFRRWTGMTPQEYRAASPQVRG